MRILAIGCIDIILTLPLGIIGLTTTIVSAVVVQKPFYLGWFNMHSAWEPIWFTYAEEKQENWIFAQLYAGLWAGPILAVAIFALFGFTPDAREAYWRGIGAVGGLFRWKLSRRAQEDAQMQTMDFACNNIETHLENRSVLHLLLVADERSADMCLHRSSRRGFDISIAYGQSSRTGSDAEASRPAGSMVEVFEKGV
jgi:hypothetical protein